MRNNLVAHTTLKGTASTGLFPTPQRITQTINAKPLHNVHDPCGDMLTTQR
jgi:hypothetical protein